jgi:hypothetical protein
MIKWWIVMNHSKHATPEAGIASVYSVYTARRRPLFCNCLLCNSLRIRAWTNTMESHRSDEIHGEWCCTCGISAPLFRFAEVHCSTVCWSVPFWTHETFQVYHGLVTGGRVPNSSGFYSIPSCIWSSRFLKDVSIVLLFLLLAETHVSIQKKIGL